MQEVFEGALGLPQARRAAFLDEECGGDRAFREQVEQLLACDAEDDGFLDTLDRTRAVDLSPESGDPFLGERIGAYRVEALIARGGMGAVYRAERVGADFEQTVALKILKRGLDTDEILRRFRVERQVLARLEHPHIARLYDGGATEQGLPYLVMELVDGAPIDQYCDERRIGIRERIALFIDVCRAVQFAHHRLVVHRDLKPSNILVATDGTPKLLDFGIAKVIDPDVDEMPVSTVTELRIMTPRYASPEQVRGEPTTTGTDVFSLGVILYELLCGRTPHPVRTTSVEEMQRAVCEVDPTRPSIALARATDTTSAGIDPDAIAEARRTDRRRLASLLSGDLETVTLKALAKEPARRYASPGRLAEDLERYLAGRPVEARRDTWAYRATKFVRRNAIPLALASTFLLLLAGAAAVTLWQRFELGLAGDEVDRLSDMSRLEEATRRAESLLEIDPRLLPEYETWLEQRGRPLRRRLNEHEARLLEVRARASAYTEAEARRDREQHPEFESLGRLRSVVQALRDRDASAPELAEMDAELADLSSRVDTRRTWTFDHTKDQFLHESIESFLEAAKPFFAEDPRLGVLSGMEWRYQQSLRLEAREPDLRAAWGVVREEILRAPRYRG
ncbi:MAG: serine/threonine protein kinase, partial [Planctomycetes bacterium]|nr:serine/threonine protein kinase [Planctomycetota bacterium]